jgi:hypothetical protein
MRKWLLKTWRKANPDEDRLDPERDRSRFPARCTLAGDRIGEEDAPGAALVIAAFCRVHDQDRLTRTLARAMADPADLLPDDRYFASLAMFQYLDRASFAAWYQRCDRAMTAESERARAPAGGARWPEGGVRRSSALSATAYTGLTREIYYRFNQVGDGSGTTQAPIAPPVPAMPSRRAQ